MSLYREASVGGLTVGLGPGFQQRDGPPYFETFGVRLNEETHLGLWEWTFGKNDSISLHIVSFGFRDTYSFGDRSRMVSFDTSARLSIRDAVLQYFSDTSRLQEMWGPSVKGGGFTGIVLFDHEWIVGNDLSYLPEPY